MSSLSEAKTERIKLRVSPAVKQVLRDAAASVSTNISEFILRAGMDAACQTLASGDVMMLSREDFQKFNEALERPAVCRPGLAKLLSEPSVLE